LAESRLKAFREIFVIPVAGFKNRIRDLRHRWLATTLCRAASRWNFLTAEIHNFIRGVNMTSVVKPAICPEINLILIVRVEIIDIPSKNILKGIVNAQIIRKVGVRFRGSSVP